jgi:hypothetical protein
MTSPQQTSTSANEYPYTFDINQWTAQVHAPQPRHASAAPLRAVPPPLSSHFQATFARQMEANPPNLRDDPNEIQIPIRPFQNPPIYLSPTIEEIESLTLNSGPLQDMGDYLVDDIHAITLWEHLQQNLFHARQMEGIARNLREQATIEWERFRTKKFDMRIMGIVEREREVMRRFDEEGSGHGQPRLVVERPSPPLAVVLPGYRRTPTPLPVAGPSDTDDHNPRTPSNHLRQEPFRIPSSSKKVTATKLLPATTQPPNHGYRLQRKNENNGDVDESRKLSTEPETERFERWGEAGDSLNESGRFNLEREVMLRSTNFIFLYELFSRLVHSIAVYSFHYPEHCRTTAPLCIPITQNTAFSYLWLYGQLRTA